MNRSHVTERDLRLFLVLDALLEHGSVMRAAGGLGLTPSAVSHALRALRERLDDPLFTRVGDRMLPTPRAMALRPALRLGLAEFGRVLAGEAAFRPDSSTRLFSAATHDDMIFTVVPEVVTRLRRDAPGVELRFDAIGPGLPDALASGRVDLVLARGDVGPALGPGGSVVRTRVASEPWVCLLRADHPAAAGPLTLDAYLASPHVAVAAAGTADPVDAALAEVGHRRRVAVAVPSYPAAGWFAAASDMIATLPERVALRGAPRLDLVISPPPLDLPLSHTHLWWHERFQKDDGHAWWRGLLADAFRLP